MEFNILFSQSPRACPLDHQLLVPGNLIISYIEMLNRTFVGTEKVTLPSKVMKTRNFLETSLTGRRSRLLFPLLTRGTFSMYWYIRQG